MHLSYEKLATDHKMYGKAEYIVMDGMQAVCYKSKNGYIALESDGRSKPKIVQEKISSNQQRASSLFVLSFTINGEKEEMTFKSKNKMDKTIAFYKEKAFIDNLSSVEYKLEP